MTIEQAIRKSGLSQAEIARRVGVSRAAICRWANGSRSMLEPVARALAAVLGVERETLRVRTRTVQNG